MAMSHLGAGRPIVSVATDDTNEAEVLRRFYDITLEQMLREFSWPFSVTAKDLVKSHNRYGVSLASASSLVGAQPVYGDDVPTHATVIAGVDTDSGVFVDVVVSTDLSSDGYVTVTLQGGPVGFASATDIQTIGIIPASSAAGFRITAEVDADDLAYANYRLKFVASDGNQSAGAVTAYFAEGTGAPTDEWAYSYEYPSDCLKIVRVGSSLRTDTYDTKVPFKIYHAKSYSASGSPVYSIQQQILCDESDAAIEYVTNECVYGNDTDEVYPPDFAMALSLRLACVCAPRMTAGDGGMLVKSLWERYFYEVSRAAANAMNEAGSDVPPDSEYVRARE